MEASMTLITAIVVLAFAYVAIPVALAAYRRYRGVRRVECPATGTPAEIEIDALTAAVSAAAGPPLVDVTRCTHWPEREDCGRECLAQIERPAGGARAA
jgi:hypothetical protein